MSDERPMYKEATLLLNAQANVTNAWRKQAITELVAKLAARDAEIAAFKDTLGRRTRQLDEMVKTIEDRDAEIARLRAAAEEREQALLFARTAARLNERDALACACFRAALADAEAALTAAADGMERHWEGQRIAGLVYAARAAADRAKNAREGV